MPWVSSFFLPLSAIEQGNFDITQLNIYKTMALYSIGTLLAIIVVWCLPFNEYSGKIVINERYVFWCYLILYLIALGKIFSPFLRQYLLKLDVILHLTHWRAFFDLLYYWGAMEASIFSLFILLVITIIMKGSRASPLYVSMLLFGLVIINPKAKKRIIYTFITLIILTITIPWHFRFSTLVKIINTQTNENMPENLASKNISDFKKLYHQSNDALKQHPLQFIISRISNLERGGLAIFYKDNPDHPYVKERLKLFLKLNNPLRQLKLFANAFIIGSFFEVDEPPNQYNIHIFIGRDIKEIKERYVSWSMGLISYLYLFFGYIGSLIAFVLIVVSLYLICIWSKKHSPVFYISILLYFYFILDFFDITYHLMGLLFISTSMFFAGVSLIKLNKIDINFLKIFSLVKQTLLKLK